MLSSPSVVPVNVFMCFFLLLTSFKKMLNHFKSPSLPKNLLSFHRYKSVSILLYSLFFSIIKQHQMFLKKLHITLSTRIICMIPSKEKINEKSEKKIMNKSTLVCTTIMTHYYYNGDKTYSYQ